jgi:DNA (cytosine-5)-methyltransferase 1
MIKKYSDIKAKLKIDVNKTTDNGLAHLTHYFQNQNNGVSQYFKPAATNYLENLHSELNIFEDPDFQKLYVPIFLSFSQNL